MMNKSILLAAVVMALASFSSIGTNSATANHEFGLRQLGIGYNDYDHDGVTCAATDYQADLWSDQFYNHHIVDMNRLIACENKERSYAGLPPEADNQDHIQSLINQYNGMYGPGSGWAESFGGR
jgi:hypothetical protein